MLVCFVIRIPTNRTVTITRVLITPNHTHTYPKKKRVRRFRVDQATCLTVPERA
jgi:hypothetical protein